LVANDYLDYIALVDDDSMEISDRNLESMQTSQTEFRETQPSNEAVELVLKAPLESTEDVHGRDVDFAIDKKLLSFENDASR
jgi:hypothetical protein